MANRCDSVRVCVVVLFPHFLRFLFFNWLQFTVILRILKTSGYILITFQLILTVGLLAVVVYLYTVLAFNFFRKFYNKSEDKDTRDMKCNDMLTVRKNLNF